MSEKKELVIITFKLPPDLLEKLDKLVKKLYKVNRSYFIRDAIIEKMDREELKGGG